MSSSSSLGNKVERGTLGSTHSEHQTPHQKQFYSSKYHPNNRLSDEKIQQVNNDPWQWQSQSSQQRNSSTTGNSSGGDTKAPRGADKRFVDYKEGDQEEEDDEDDEDVDENLGNMYDSAQYN
ncbi:hypothetical protein BG011_001214 [Mortierella polycephala]|uniref:Uncharacterized protein n=1 Tax=Mortierella polycephala TaxID=41804 RepID=A0A9P6QHJ1_9FUNG|nr:hypothetical protein BG011_001214 [Mortierella polycephala]